MKHLSIQQIMNHNLDVSYGFTIVDGRYYCEDNAVALDVSAEENMNRRLQHTLKWCERNQRDHVYDQTIIVGSEQSPQVLSRRISCQYHGQGHLDIKIAAVAEGNSVLVSHSLDEQLLNAMSDAFLLTEADIIEQPGPRIIYCNRAYTMMSGYEKHEVIGKSPRILQGDDSSEEAKKNIKIALQNWQSIKQRIVNYKKDGTKFIVELNISPVTDETGWYTHWVSVQRDVTSEQADIELVRQSRFILESNQIGCWYYNITDDHCYFDQVMLSLHQTTLQGFDNKLSTWSSLIYKDDVAKFRHTLAKSITQHNHLELEYRIDGIKTGLLLLKLNSRLLIDNLNGKEMLAGTCFNITSERKAQQEIEQHRKVAIETAKLASIGHLASGVGHEINNPLSVITASLEVAEAKLENYHDAFHIAKPWFEKIDKACLRIAKIVDGLRSVSNIHREFESLTPVNLYSHGLETFDFYKHLLAAEGITFQLTLNTDIESCWFLGDYAKYQQILVNLLNNAKDAVESTPERRIDCIISNQQDHCQLHVSDTGCGISQENIEKIFDPFVTTKPVGKGTGLGLSITQSIVRLFSGEISLLTANTKGACFSVKFPCIEGKSESMQTQCQINPDAISVLLVEDEEDVGNCAEELLHMLNCKVTRAVDGESALQRALETDFDLMLVDLKMPVVNGWQFLEKLALLKLAKRTRKYILTGEVISQIDPKGKTLHKLANGVLQKPIRKMDLAKIVSAVSHV